MSTLIGTFTTGMNLYERIGEKRKQKRTDEGQDDKIKALQKQIDDVKKQKDESDDRANWAVERRRKEVREEDIPDSFRRGHRDIGREYERDYRRFGDRFAEGDIITQNQLQGQVITLQSTVIGLLEDALYTGRIADVNKLYNASELARDGSIAALQQQYQRMLEAAPVRRGMALRLPLLRRTSSTPTIKSLPAPKSGPGSVANATNGDRETKIELKLRESKTMDGGARSEVREVRDDYFSADGPLFCRYAVTLQQSPRLALAADFAPGGANRCPECATYVNVEQGRAWKIVKEVVHEKVSTPAYNEEQIEERTYLVGNRFVVKCHRERMGFACALCARFRDRDTVLESAQGLVRHVWQKHDAEEYELEPDIRETG